MVDEYSHPLDPLTVLEVREHGPRAAQVLKFVRKVLEPISPPCQDFRHVQCSLSVRIRAAVVPIHVPFCLQVKRAADACKSFFAARFPGVGPLRFNTVTLEEPSKAAMVAYDKVRPPW